MSENVSAVFQPHLPPKLKDPGSFNIKISLGDSKSVKAMLDLGASINLMPYSVYKQLGLGELKPTTMTLQLADHSVKHPLGVVEDILVQVEKLIVPVDFVMIDMEQGVSMCHEPPILLGRPFMATTDTNINVKNGKLTMNVLDQKVELSVFEVTKEPVVVNESCCYVTNHDEQVKEKWGQEANSNERELVLNGGEKTRDSADVHVMAINTKAEEHHPSDGPLHPLGHFAMKSVPFIKTCATLVCPCFAGDHEKDKTSRKKKTRDKGPPTVNWLFPESLKKGSCVWKVVGISAREHARWSKGRKAKAKDNKANLNPS